MDCLRFEPHGSHAHFDKVMKWINEIKPKRTVLTHMNYEVDYEYINSSSKINDKKKLDSIIIFHIQRVLFEFKLKKISAITSFDLIAFLMSKFVMLVIREDIVPRLLLL